MVVRRVGIFLALLSTLFYSVVLGAVLLLGWVLFMARFDSIAPHERMSALVARGQLLGWL